VPRDLSILPTLLLLAGLTAPAIASHVVVPTDTPTIQAAIDGGTDSIAVLDGTAPERLTVARCVVIEPVTGYRPFLGPWTSSPQIRSLEILTPASYPCASGGVVLRGVRFLGKVDASSIYNGTSITFEACRFDSGFAGPAGGIQTSFAVLSVRGCLFLGDANLSGYVQFVSNTVIGGTLRVRADGVHDIRDNFVQGPAPAGMQLNLQESIGQVARNSIRGTTDGMRFTGNTSMNASQNDIADCSGNGIDFHSGGYPGFARCDSNSIARCGGTGIIVRSDDPSALPFVGMSGNNVRQTGLDGITIVHGFTFPARGNVILDAGGNGFTAFVADSFENNVIGRSHAAGVRIVSEPAYLVGNTIFSSGGPGIDIQNAISGDQVTHNVSVFNGGPGLSFEGSHPPQLSCNDWFGNVGGQTVGVPSNYSDISVNPRFCDLGASDVHLSATSPLLADPNCGLIGALGQGCGTTTEVPEADNEATFHVWPIPARGAVSFVIPTSTGTAKVEVFDVSGARRWESTIPAGATRVEWDRREGSGQLVAPGIYFARLRRQGVEVARARMILTK